MRPALENSLLQQKLKINLSLKNEHLNDFFGPNDAILKLFEKMHSKVKVFVLSNEIYLEGTSQDIEIAEAHLTQLDKLFRQQNTLDEKDLKTTFSELQNLTQNKAQTSPTAQVETSTMLLSNEILKVRGKSIRAQTRGQRDYINAIDEHTITFGIGPAGTGKTYLAVAKAVAAFSNREVSKIILTRPAVEAGERLGYLPGTLSEKIDPYLRPLFDAAAAMLENETVTQLLASGAIEVAPLAYMRGRTLNESFVILDEAQNTTPEQMKMFLTRLGYGSKMVVTGDLTQADLPGGVSGLKKVTKILSKVEDISFQYLTSDDIVRHSLVGKIVDAYEIFESKDSLK